ncbi:hypothetical protein C491_01182 [Natronococcus amylolyticus DSM 10524]|uniref:Uncharacterized protein n=1 Tax=Natronococcus amylolyticus DSM 10524 TaxID=1227497 RepID=L9XL89_9EURY|nr:hypothetical protein [Natronococcus amylolyticus]ELY61428.1 hypothetical protein C491_01182 [Natronococcus amylolyticus DSM 10524]
MSEDLPYDEGVLTPEELSLERDTVDDLGENRFLVRSEGDDSSAVLTDGRGGVERSSSEIGSDLADTPQPHAVDIALKVDGEVARHRASSSDVREVFAELLTWYATQLDDDLSPEATLRLMLEHADLER